LPEGARTCHPHAFCVGIVTGAATQIHAALFGSAPLSLIDVSFAYILEETWSIVLVGCLRIPNDSVGFNGQSRVHKERYR
jgi:hypothetical protein